MHTFAIILPFSFCPNIITSQLGRKMCLGEKCLCNLSKHLSTNHGVTSLSQLLFCSVSRHGGCILQRTDFKTDCITAAQQGCPIWTVLTNATILFFFFSWATKDASGASFKVQSIPGFIMHQLRKESEQRKTLLNILVALQVSRKVFRYFNVKGVAVWNAAGG